MEGSRSQKDEGCLRQRNLQKSHENRLRSYQLQTAREKTRVPAPKERQQGMIKFIFSLLYFYNIYRGLMTGNISVVIPDVFHGQEG